MMLTVAITVLQSQAGVQEPGLQRLGTNPSRVLSLGLEMLHVAARSSQVAASLHVSEKQVVKERKKTLAGPHGSITGFEEGRLTFISDTARPRAPHTVLVLTQQPGLCLF